MLRFQLISERSKDCVLPYSPRPVLVHVDIICATLIIIVIDVFLGCNILRGFPLYSWLLRTSILAVGEDFNYDAQKGFHAKLSKGLHLAIGENLKVCDLKGKQRYSLPGLSK